MLDFRVNEGFDYLDQQSSVRGKTIFDIVTKPTVRTGYYSDPVIDTYTPDNPIEQNPMEHPLDDSGKIFNRQIDVPNVLGLQLTNQTSKGVFESAKPTRTWATPPIDATLFHEPAVEGLQTIQTSGSPLGANFAGSSTVASGHDPLSFFTNQPSETPQDTPPTEPDPVRPSDCGTFDFVCKFKSIKGEVTVLIVGLAILTVGIFALTR